MAEDKKPQSGTLTGQVVVVTGSTQGIGAGIAKKFAEHGARVVVHGIAQQKESGESVLVAVRASGSDGLLVLGDLKDEAHCRDIVRQAVERFGQLDILVNNAAIYPRGNIETTSVALWDEIFAVDLRAPFIVCQEAVKFMKPRQRGCIINIGSVNAYVGLRKVLAYSAAKGGLMTFTKNLANYLTRYKIRVNQINPGWVLTEGEYRTNVVDEGKDESWLEEAVKTRPFGRMLAPEDVAKAALFFATNELVSGSVLDYEQLPFGAPMDLENLSGIMQ